MSRFGPFDLDLTTGELRRNGLPVRLQEQPLRVLQALVERPGELVTREQLRARLWPSDTFVDFERSLNAAVAKLRQALGDSAEQPLYIETVARKGYRFVAPVGTGSEPGPAAAGRSGRPRATLVIAGVVLMALPALGWLVLRPSASPPRGGVAFTLTMPQGTRVEPDPYAPNAVVSPDGGAVAFVAVSDGTPGIWVRSLSSETSRQVSGTEGASSLFWSPDGKEIGFFAANKLKKVSLAGGAVLVLCEAKDPHGAAQPYGAAWNRSGVILFSGGSAIQSVSESGGSPQAVVPVDAKRGEIRQGWPSFLPDGRRFVYFSVNRDPQQHAIMLASLDDRRPRLLFRNTTKADFGSPGHLIFARDGVLYAQPWDFDAGRPRSDARMILPDVNTSAVARTAFNVSGGGLVYRTGALTRTQLVCYARDGRRIRNVGPPGPYVQVTLSPDEKMAAFHTARTDFEIPARLWLMRLDSQVVSRYDFGRSANADPVWSPDSRQIAFTAFDLMGPYPSDVMVWTVGEQSPRLLLSDGKKNKPDDWTPDGKFVLCRRNDETPFLIALEPGAHPIDIGDSATPKDQMRISPDGRFVAYNTIKSGLDVFVARFPGMKDTTQVSAAGGVQPIWTRGGKELIYAGPDSQLMSVEIRGNSAFEVSAPRPLFRASTSFSKWIGQYAVSADGQRFYVLEPSGGVNPDAWHVFTKWQDASIP